MNDNAVSSARSVEKVQLSIQLDSDLVEQLEHLTNDPSRLVETAIKQWLRGERFGDTDLSRTLRRNPPVPPRGEWND
ncbi:MAG: type II toxin-antitoxin system CcdA family antitoxin [Chloroflexaceae bacterium]|nr:type II toxin-antitoxin system CcdA family antitoxin [Chloroflexaceae bacterium]